MSIGDLGLAVTRQNLYGQKAGHNGHTHAIDRGIWAVSAANAIVNKNACAVSDNTGTCHTSPSNCVRRPATAAYTASGYGRGSAAGTGGGTGVEPVMCQSSPTRSLDNRYARASRPVDKGRYLSIRGNVGAIWQADV